MWCLNTPPSHLHQEMPFLNVPPEFLAEAETLQGFLPSGAQVPGGLSSQGAGQMVHGEANFGDNL